MKQLLNNIEASLRAAPRNVYVIYYNPISVGVFDGSKLLERRYAAMIPCDPVERDYAPNEMEGVAVWQNRGNRNLPIPTKPIAAILKDNDLRVHEVML